MRNYKFSGLFVSAEGNMFELSTSCDSFIQAFFLLTADAIRLGRHYQLHSITKEGGSTVKVDDILKVSALLKEI
ncbi:MAG: hypothetical protein KatS3mg035_1049 [Bacteroidia bacterium]|nr:MAG: hypothetical protein KatS3mg035_1049 [Bacteroidia bacterium]